MNVLWRSLARMSAKLIFLLSVAGCFGSLFFSFFMLIMPLSVLADMNNVTEQLQVGAIIKSEEKGSINALWVQGGNDTTSRGDKVFWGYFHANPSDVTWGDKNNPDAFVKVWFDAST